MRFSIGVVFLAILIQIVSPLPQPIQDEVYDDDTQQQQQQQVVDAQMLEEFSKNLPSKTGDGVTKQPRNDPCLEPLVVGPCKARMPKFYFNSVEGKCERFYYGGCQGTKNNFETFPDCEEKCSSHIKRLETLKLGTSDPDLEAVTEICESPPVADGPSCGGLMPRWTFNSSQGKCVQFIYGGCRATKNNYPNKILCNAMCEKYQNQKNQQPKGENDEQKESKENEICRLPKSVGLCYGIQQKYHFNQENNRCERFEYSGCGGNDNRFNTPEECIRACGGETPANDVQCSNVDCPWSLYTHYSSLGCKPIYDGQACCPTRFECPDHRNNDNSLRGLRTLRVEEAGTTTATTPTEESSAQCMYKGQSYAVGESVDEASDVGSCRASCFCNGLGPNPKIMCANIECPEQLGAIPPGKEGCLPLYKKGSCCAYDFYCPVESAEEQQEVEKPHKCELEGKQYYEGERIYPKQSSCLRCICKKQFNGSLTSEFCEKIDCGIEIYYSDYLAKGCAPVYFHSEDGDRCCPIYWKCPEEKKSPNPPITILPIEDRGEPVTPDESGGLVTPSPPIASDPISIMPVDDSMAREEIEKPVSPTSTHLHLKEKWHRRVTHESCQLPLAPGDCKGTRPRYYFNNETETCEKFIFTGCNGNENNFVAVQDCEKLCKNNNTEESTTTTTGSPFARSALKPHSEREERSILLSEVDPCTMPVRRGFCRAYFPRYFYSPEENSCKFFIFGGCRGNHNNFYTVDSCEATCMNKIPIANLRTSILTEEEGDSSKVIFGEDVMEVSTTTATLEEPDPCNLPPVVGSCKAYIRRFYYDPEAKYCKRFIFGGCGGNANNFLGLRECDLRCSPNAGKGLPHKHRHTHSGTTLITSETTTISPESNAIQPTNGQDTVSRPPHFGFTEKCRLPLKVGPCYAHQPSFYYDVLTKSCQAFTYGGCFGNANRFSTFAECTKTCTRPVATEGKNSEQDQHPFARSGLGHLNRPQPTLASSPETSEIDEKLFCQLPPEKGDETCKSHILRYYWDAGAWKCLPFVYTGCKGNKNNFLTESDCLSMCGNDPTIEQLTSEGILSCTFGNETYPLGASVPDPGQEHFHYGHQEPPCGVPVCQCLTPPSVTCIQTMCPTPPPPPPTTTTTTTEKICPTPSCGPNCKEATGLDGCPTCDCDQDSTSFHTTQVRLPEPSIKTVKG